MHQRQMSVERGTINYLHVSHGGDDHQLLSSFSDHSLQTMY